MFKSITQTICVSSQSADIYLNQSPIKNNNMHGLQLSCIMGYILVALTSDKNGLTSEESGMSSVSKTGNFENEGTC